MWASKAAIAVIGLLVLGACDRPMGAFDGVSPVAGHAPSANVRNHTVDPNAGRRATPNPGGDGQRAAAVIESYRRAGPVAAEGDEAAADGTGADGE